MNRFDSPRLIADIGGTYARFAVETATGHFEHLASLRCAEHADFHAAVSAYLAGLPAGTIVLPGHGVPFRSLRQRLAYLQAHHEERLATLAAAVAVAGLVTGFTMARHLFPRAVDTEHGWIALCETLAHLRRLQRTGALIATADADGQVRYRHA